MAPSWYFAAGPAGAVAVAGALVSSLTVSCSLLQKDITGTKGRRHPGTSDGQPRKNPQFHLLDDAPFSPQTRQDQFFRKVGQRSRGLRDAYHVVPDSKPRTGHGWDAVTKMLPGFVGRRPRPRGSRARPSALRLFHTDEKWAVQISEGFQKIWFAAEAAGHGFDAVTEMLPGFVGCLAASGRQPRPRQY